MDNNSALLFIMRPLFFFLAKSSLDRESSFELQVKMVAGLLFCVVMTGRRRSGMGTRRGMQPFLWLRWVEVSPKRFSLPSLLTHSDRCTCPFGQMAKFCLILFCSHRRERDGRGDAHDRTFFAKNLQVIPVVCLSCVA